MKRIRNIILKNAKFKQVKIITLIITFFFAIMMPSANAAPGGAIVIIDSYFDNRIANTTIVCVAVDKCDNKATTSTKVSDPVNHGMAMVDVARRNRFCCARSGGTACAAG